MPRKNIKLLKNQDAERLQVEDPQQSPQIQEVNLTPSPELQEELDKAVYEKNRQSIAAATGLDVGSCLVRFFARQFQ